MSNKLTRTIAVLCLVAFLAFGCSSREDEQTNQQQSKSQTKAPTEKSSAPKSTISATQTQEQLAAKAEQTQQTLAQMNEGKVVEPIDFRKLKELLPDSVQGLKQSDSSGERVKMMGVDIARAEAEYQGEGDDKHISIIIMDTGNVSGPMRMGMAAWAMTEIEHETDTSYERTTTYKGHKAMEEFDKQAQQGTFHVYVADRFIVEANGVNVPMETIKKAIDSIDIGKLTSLAATP